MTGEQDMARSQFGKNADAYANSNIHATGSGLQHLLSLAAPFGTEVLLDVSTGAGHTAFTFAPRVQRIIASDLTPEMLGVARRLAAERGLHNIEFTLADVEALPFPDSSFDLVTCRIAAHHYPNLPQAVQEMARVLRFGGKLLVEDNYAPAQETADRFINAVEKMRDPSHVRAWSLAEWSEAFSKAGLEARVAQQSESPVEFEDWVKRAQTPGENVAVLRGMLQMAPPVCQTTFSIKLDPLQFNLHKVIWVAEKNRVGGGG